MARQLPMILLASLNFRSTFSQLSQRKVFVYREGMICQLCFMLRIAASLAYIHSFILIPFFKVIHFSAVFIMSWHDG